MLAFVMSGDESNDAMFAGNRKMLKYRRYHLVNKAGPTGEGRRNGEKDTASNLPQGEKSPVSAATSCLCDFSLIFTFGEAAVIMRHVE